jgi:prepilin-type processing-associated H-X9-DG protein
MSVALPAMHRGRASAERVKCASNIRQILQGILLYANDHKGEYPPDLGSLLSTDMAIDVFVCPSAKTEIPADIRKAPKDQQIAWVNQHSDYVYHGKGMDVRKAQPMTPVISEREGDHAPDGMNIGYGDGHVEWQTLAAAKRLLGNAPDAGEQGL